MTNLLWRARLALVLLGLGVALGAGSRLRADDADPATVDAVMMAAQHWLAQIDADKLDESYDAGCTAFQNKVSRQQWITVLKALRPSIGTMVSRKEESHSYRPDGFEGLEGECMVIKYDTNFTKLGPTLEIVVMKREDGKWRGAGYNAQPQTQAPPGD